ncbi:MAG: hypothetical protein ACJ8CR_08250 [Roseiflexaceae bacterium]
MVDQAPSLRRALDALAPAYQVLMTERYERILPILLRLLKPGEILERNRTWPGVRPADKAATRLLTTTAARALRAAIRDYVATTPEDADVLWVLVRAYCRYGPIGLIEALPTALPPLVPPELQECADFHRLAKHPRTDASTYIRQLLDQYADALQIPRLLSFVARYAFATDRHIERWFVGENTATQYIPKTTRRLNRDLTYPHSCWRVYHAPLPLTCHLSERHPLLITPHLVWICDVCTEQVMGFCLCATPPTDAPASPTAPAPPTPPPDQASRRRAAPSPPSIPGLVLYSYQLPKEPGASDAEA